MSGFQESTQNINKYIDAHHEEKILNLVWLSGVKSWRNRFARFIWKIKNGVYPAHLESFFVILALVMAFHYSSTKVPYDLLNAMVAVLPR
jgi:carnitine O-palmitoyltransferase 1, liver isoform